MSFSTYKVITPADLARGTGLAASLQKTGRGKTQAKLVLTCRPDVAAELGWAAEEMLEVAIGEDEHHGLLRLRPSAEGTARISHRTAGDGRSKRGGPFFMVNLGHVPLFVDRAETKRWVAFDRVDDGWVEIVLPAWADATGPKARADRARLSAGVAAAPLQVTPRAVNVTSAMMGDPPPGRSALAQQPGGRKAAGGAWLN
jgi:hypothetical protein